MTEEWKEVPGYPMFRVSNLGNVESMLSGTWKKRNLKKVNKGAKHGGRIYLGFNVPTGKKLLSGQLGKVTMLVHVLVAQLFIGPRPPGMNVLHTNDDRENNSLSNIVYGTQKENVRQAIANGKFKYTRGPDGKFTGSKS